METPEIWFHRRATCYVEAQILFHLNQAGVFNLLDEGGARTPAEIADTLQLDVSATQALLDYVHGVDDLLDRDARGGYSLTNFGKKVVERFSNGGRDGGRRLINLFDVRVGAYGPVWKNLGHMLAGDRRYGQDFHRNGRFAESGVSKLAMNFWRGLTDLVDESDAGCVVEVGLTSILLEKLAAWKAGLSLYGLDKSDQAIRSNAASAAAKGLGNVHWLHADFFCLDSWCQALTARGKGLIYSLHFHELIAQGEDRLLEALGRLRDLLPNWTVVAFEQPRLDRSERDAIPETQWLYSQSNVLIHHLIGNGRILSRDAWMGLGRDAGCRDVTDRPCNYLGYRAFVFQF